MLSSVITLFETLKTIGYYSIILSYNTGKIIVSGLLTSLEVLHKLMCTLWTVFVILQEDLVIFLIDLWSRIVSVLHALHNLTEYSFEAITYFFIGIKSLIFGLSDAVITICQTVVTIVTKVAASLGSLIAAIKHFMVLLGSGVWFAITIVPIFIVYLCVMATYYVGRFFEELKTLFTLAASQTLTGIEDVIIFITDVPLESLAGLIICSCLLYAIIFFHITVYSVMSRLTRNILTTVHGHLIRLKVVLVRRLRRPRAVEREEVDSSSDSEMIDSDLSYSELEPLGPLQTCDEGWKTKRQRNQELLALGDRVCVICLERDKCILSMPCRHLSTCKECNAILRNYQRNCPICRKFVSYTIHVY